MQDSPAEEQRNADSAVTGTEYSLSELLALAWHHRAVLLALPAITGLLALSLSLLIPDQYRSSAILVAGEMPASVLRSVAISDPVRDAVTDRLKLAQRFGVHDAAIRYGEMVKTVSSPREQGMLTIHATDGSPELAAQLASAVAHETIAAAHRDGITPGSKILRKLETRMDQVGRNLSAGESALAQLGVKDWRMALSPGESALMSLLADLQAGINLQGGEQKSLENSTMLLQLRLTGLQQLSDRDRHGTKLAPGVMEILRDQFYLSALHKRLTDQVEIAKRDMAGEIRLVGAASIPLTKESPKRSLFLLTGAALGFVIACIVIARREWTRRRHGAAARERRSDMTVP